MEKRSDMKYDDATGEFVEAPPSFGAVEETDLTDPAGRINFHVGMARRHGRMAFAHIILAGWELSKQKDMLGYGRWSAWCKRELAISQDTADRYIMFFAKTVGAVRAARQIPFAKRVTRAELEEATGGLEEKSVTRAMVDLGIVRRTERWGGRREGAGSVDIRSEPLVSRAQIYTNTVNFQQEENRHDETL